MAKKKKQEPMKSCADCIHEDACRMWTNGRMIADESASRCPEHTKLRESAAYHIGKLEGVTVQRWIPVTEPPEVGVKVLTLDKWGHVRDRELYQFSDGLKLFRPDGMLPGKDITHWRPMLRGPKEA